MQFIYILAIILGVFGVSFLMMNIRHIFTGREFRGGCASNNPMLKNEIGECTVCGRREGDACKSPEVVAPKKAV